MKRPFDFHIGRPVWFVPAWFALGIIVCLLILWLYHPRWPKPVTPEDVQKPRAISTSMPAKGDK